MATSEYEISEYEIYYKNYYKLSGIHFLEVPVFFNNYLLFLIVYLVIAPNTSILQETFLQPNIRANTCQFLYNLSLWNV